MKFRATTILTVLLVPVVAFAAPPRRAVTTDDCLGKGLCAYVSPHGRVTCGKCPGQVVAKAISVPHGTAAICTDGSFARLEKSARMCRAGGGVAARVGP
jgi:hypothetical protein